MSEEVNKIVKAAILNTREHNPLYYVACLAQRLKNGQGSTTDYTVVEDLEQQLLDSDWEEYKHPNIADNCSAYITKSFGGYVGMIPIEYLSNQLICRLDDIKGTGKLSLTCYADTDRYSVDYNVLIVGDDGYGPCMFTFHPGEPVKPSTLSADGHNEFGLKEGDIINVAQAKDFGFKHVKLLSIPMLKGKAQKLGAKKIKPL